MLREAGLWLYHEYPGFLKGKAPRSDSRRGAPIFLPYTKKTIPRLHETAGLPFPLLLVDEIVFNEITKFSFLASSLQGTGRLPGELAGRGVFRLRCGPRSCLLRPGSAGCRPGR